VLAFCATSPPTNPLHVLPPVLLPVLPPLLPCRYRKPLPAKYQAVMDSVATKQAEIEAFHQKHHKNEVGGWVGLGGWVGGLAGNLVGGIVEVGGLECWF
jgi:hypothetical protein